MSAIERAPRQSFSLSVVPRRSEIAVVPGGDLDLACADALEDEVRELRRSGFERVVIDLRGVEFMDSTGLRVLLSLRNDAKRDGVSRRSRPDRPRSCALVGPRPYWS